KVSHISSCSVPDVVFIIGSLAECNRSTSCPDLFGSHSACQHTCPVRRSLGGCPASVFPPALCNRSTASRFPSTFRKVSARSNVCKRLLLRIRTYRCRRQPSRNGNFHRPHSTSRSDRPIVSGFCRSAPRFVAAGHEPDGPGAAAVDI